jgi:septal ring factor EnvC (AmiA/AmiB activator)
LQSRAASSEQSNASIQTEVEVLTSQLQESNNKNAELNTLLLTLKNEKADCEKRQSRLQEQYDKCMELMSALQEDLDLARKQEALLRCYSYADYCDCFLPSQKTERYVLCVSTGTRFRIAAARKVNYLAN